MIQEIKTTSSNESKFITMHLHPAELGKLTLHVGWEADSIIAKIVATELATSDLLNQDKSWLIDTLQKNGVELDSLDVSYGGEQYEQQSRQQEQSGLTPKPPQKNASTIQTHTTRVVGTDAPLINLIA